jgi:hypothetical protein
MGRQLIFAALCLSMASSALGQSVESNSVRSSSTHAPGPRPVTKTEGRNILAAISNVDVDLDSETDCSHLVHAVYEKAGFPYDYATSSDLYIGSGSANFTRVRSPQPGDLVVWRGHVGIVSNPKEHSFFSFTRTGPDTQFYDSAYWRSRGSARFYRYMTEKTVRSNRTLEAKHGEEEGSVAVATRREENRPPSKLPKSLPASNAVLVADPPSSGTAELPREIVLQVAGKNPAPEEVAAAFAEMNLDSVKSLRMRGMDAFARPLIVYREIRVSALEIKGNHGAALLRVESFGGSPETPTGSQTRWKELSLELEKTKRGWVMRPSLEAAYVSREAAMQVLSARLAELTRNANPTLEQEREKKQIIRFLNSLVLDEPKAVSAQSN